MENHWLVVFLLFSVRLVIATTTDTSNESTTSYVTESESISKSSPEQASTEYIAPSTTEVLIPVEKEKHEEKPSPVVSLFRSPSSIKTVPFAHRVKHPETTTVQEIVTDPPTTTEADVSQGFQEVEHFAGIKQFKASSIKTAPVAAQAIQDPVYEQQRAQQHIQPQEQQKQQEPQVSFQPVQQQAQFNQQQQQAQQIQYNQQQQEQQVQYNQQQQQQQQVQYNQQQQQIQHNQSQQQVQLNQPQQQQQQQVQYNQPQQQVQFHPVEEQVQYNQHQPQQQQQVQYNQQQQQVQEQTAQLNQPQQQQQHVQYQPQFSQIQYQQQEQQKQQEQQRVNFNEIKPKVKHPFSHLSAEERMKKADKALEEFFNDILQNLSVKMKTGMDEPVGEVLDPVRLDDMQLQPLVAGEVFDVKMKRITVGGLSDYRITQLESQLNDSRVKIGIHYPKLYANCLFSANGSLYEIFKVTGKGNATIIFNEVHARTVLYLTKENGVLQINSADQPYVDFSSAEILFRDEDAAEGSEPVKAESVATQLGPLYFWVLTANAVDKVDYPMALYFNKALKNFPLSNFLEGHIFRQRHLRVHVPHQPLPYAYVSSEQIKA
ncbi:hypothetical protein JTE90_021916 [Oedothorax gibbosus]|uniref:Uncharacterized protein n=1 Tax=Oedothorax gibbosus TaxID=931172 RepID=A0AAV6VU80_9ARAC|nr:hypothetical protein JTE90_021916 [Oedothorax gibbosus]